MELRSVSVGANGEVAVNTSHGWTMSKDTGKTWDDSRLQMEHPSIHRLVLSIHNGYFFGPRFVWLYDFAAAALLVLIVTGFVLWKQGRSVG